MLTHYLLYPFENMLLIIDAYNCDDELYCDYSYAKVHRCCRYLSIIIHKRKGPELQDEPH